MGAAHSSLRGHHARRLAGAYWNLNAGVITWSVAHVYAFHPLLCQNGNPTLNSLPNAPPVPQQVLLEPPKMIEHKITNGTTRNILLVGLTGAGKSETGNRLCRFECFKNQPFATSASQLSVTSKVDYEDVPLGRWPGGWKAWSPHTWMHDKLPKHTFRIIVAPGFFDTTLTHEQVSQCLDTFGGAAREGLVAIIVVVRDGRITPQDQEVFKFIEAVVGHDAMSKYGILVVTHTEKSSMQLQSEFKSLPQANLGRRFSDAVNGRVIGLGKWTFPRELYTTIEQLCDSNAGTALDCNMMKFSRIQEQKNKEFEVATHDLREKAHRSDKDKEAAELRARQAEESLADIQRQRNGEITYIADYRVSRGGGDGLEFGSGFMAGVASTMGAAAAGAAACTGACSIQ